MVELRKGGGNRANLPMRTVMEKEGGVSIILMALHITPHPPPLQTSTLPMYDADADVNRWEGRRRSKIPHRGICDIVLISQNWPTGGCGNHSEGGADIDWGLRDILQKCADALRRHNIDTANSNTRGIFGTRPPLYCYREENTSRSSYRA